MTDNSDTNIDFQDKLADLQETMEREKVQLPSEFEEYLQRKISLIQQKLSNKENITERDINFIDTVKEFITDPYKFLKGYNPSDELTLSEETIHNIEAKKRGITYNQWVDLLHITEIQNLSRKDIDKDFRFIDGNIVYVKDENPNELRFVDEPRLNRFPERLYLKKLVLINCKNLKILPNSLKFEKLQLENPPDLNELLKNSNKDISLYLFNFDEDLPDILNGYKELLIFNSIKSGTPKFPPDFYVYNKLTISGCEHFEELPDSLIENTEVTIKNCPNFKTVPKELKKLAKLKIDECESFQSLPENISIINIQISDCENFQELPHTYIASCKLFRCEKFKQIPEGFDCRILHIRNIDKINSIPHIPSLKELVIGDCKHFRELPKKMDINYLTLQRCHWIRELPEQLVVNGILCISDCNGIDSFPLGYHPQTENIQLVDLKIKKLPENLNCTKLTIYNCRSLTSWPKNLEIYQLSLEGELNNPLFIKEANELKKEGKINIIR